MEMVVKMKKGIASQVFIYIFAVIVMAMILYFGFTQIVNLKGLTDKSVYITFREDFRDAVNEVYYKNKGSILVFSDESRNKPLELPKGLNSVCFEESKVILNPPDYDSFIVEFLKGDGCINVIKGRLSFKLENVVIEQDIYVMVSAV
jgi:hypothetical protein